MRSRQEGQGGWQGGVNGKGPRKGLHLEGLQGLDSGAGSRLEEGQGGVNGWVGGWGAKERVASGGRARGQTVGRVANSEVLGVQVGSE